MKKELLYRELAKYYDLIYSFKDYKKDAKRILKLISRYKKSKGKDLLDVACGTGQHLNYLRKKFSCTGMDINSQMLRIAKNRLKNMIIIKANMTNFEFNKKFDVITCLFSSIGYAKTHTQLIRTINNLSRHLKKGGIVIIDGWIKPELFNVGFLHLDTYNSDKLKIVRMGISRRKGNKSILEMNYLIGEGKRIKHFKDLHELGLFEVSKFLKIMKNAGLRAIFLKKGFLEDRGVYVGVKS
ncbi:MAG: class I SAM-dependent methyltransferase [Nanoarchaeota archaeon]